MLKKIAFLCVNPWERFLPATFHGCLRSYYEQACNETLLREENMYCKERIELYGESKLSAKEVLFQNQKKLPQLLYIQSSQKELLTEACEGADLVIVEISGSKKECDRAFLSVMPWREKTLFLWDDRVCEERFLKQIKREYGLEEKQMLEVKKLPSFLTEALSH